MAEEPTYCPRCFQIVEAKRVFCRHCGQFVHAHVSGDSHPWDTRPLDFSRYPIAVSAPPPTVLFPSEPQAGGALAAIEAMGGAVRVRDVQPEAEPPDINDEGDDDLPSPESPPTT